MKKSATGLYLSAQPHKSSPRVSGACCSFPSNGLSPATPDAGDLRGDIHWRKLLLGSVAAGIALFGYGRSSYAACVTSGTTITCTGDMSAGVPAVANPITTLNVNSLTTNITPASTVDGINFTSTGDITINSDTGDFTISVTGAGADGIYASSSGAGAISITHTGDITSNSNYGIYAQSTAGSVTTMSTGNIQADEEGIHAISFGAGAVSVTHTGDITSDNNRGIFARSDSGSVKTMSTGNIQAVRYGIYARSNGAGAVSVTHTGDIKADTYQGIFAYSFAGSVTTMSTGNIQADDEGIRALSNGAGAVSITHTGDITSDSNVGVYARSATGSVATMSTGTIQADDHGIYALSNGGASAASVTHTGDITSDNGRGISATSSSGSVMTVSTGTIQAYSDGINARSFGAGAANVAHTGDITSDNGIGISARSPGAQTTHSTGNIQAYFGGIYAYGDLAVSVTHTGDITSDNSYGIQANSATGSVTTVSTGNIQANSQGIFARNTGAGAVSVTHTGDITSNADRGIFASSAGGGSVEITLGDGVVQGANNEAIALFSTTEKTLNLNAGSVLIGTIEFNGTGAAVLNTGPGLSIAHTFTGTVPTIGNVSGNIAVVSGNQIAVADISGFAAADNQLSIMLDGLSGALGTARHRGDGSVWISAFGGVSKLDGTSMAPKADQSFGGFVVGAHTALGNAIKLGVFGGLSESSQSFDVTNGVETDISSFFGGFYGSYMARMLSLDFAIAAGFTNNDGTRIVANNTVATGLETAQSDHDSFFFAPELTLSTQPINIRDFAFIPSVRVRYELLKSEGFTETGLTSGALTMGDSTSHALNVRLQGAMPFDLHNDTTKIVARAGIDARFATHSGWDATLLGVAVNDAGSEDENSAGGFLGLDFIQALSDSASLSAGGELRADTTGISAIGNFGMKIEF